MTLISNFKKRTLWPPYNVWTLKSTFIAPSLSSLTLFMKKSFHWSALCHTGHLTFLSQSWFFFYFLQTLHWYIFFPQCRQSSSWEKRYISSEAFFPNFMNRWKIVIKVGRYGYGVSFVHLEVPLIYDHLWRCWWHFSQSCCSSSTWIVSSHKKKWRAMIGLLLALRAIYKIRGYLWGI